MGEIEHRRYRIDLNAIPQLEHEMGLDYYEGFTDWACNDNTAMYQHMISTASYNQSFNSNTSTLAGIEQSSESPALSSPSLCGVLPCQKERVRKIFPMPLSVHISLTFNLSDEPRTVPRKELFASGRRAISVRSNRS